MQVVGVPGRTDGINEVSLAGRLFSSPISFSDKHRSQLLLNAFYILVSIMTALLLSPIFLETDMLPHTRVTVLALSWVLRLSLVSMTDSVLLVLLCNLTCKLVLLAFFLSMSIC